MDVSVRYNFKPFVQGADWNRTLVFTTGGVAVPLTGYRAIMTIRDEPHSGGTELLTLASASSDNSAGNLDSSITITEAEGILTLKISDEDSDLFIWKNNKAYYDVKLYEPASDGGEVHVPVYGDLEIIPKVTL